MIKLIRAWITGLTSAALLASALFVTNATAQANQGASRQDSVLQDSVHQDNSNQGDHNEGALVIYGAAYLSEIKPLLDDFQRRNPEITVRYQAMSSNVLDAHIRDQKPDQPDITISSVMDLQLRLVNDGYALPYQINVPGYGSQSGIVPHWSQWRNELFGFSYEPAVIVFNESFLEGKEVPLSRVELLSFIRLHSEELMGKVGLFDIRDVGIGYLLWSFERAQTSNYGQFLELFNLHQARTFDSSASMLQALTNGDIAIAYNIMGSYANSWESKHKDVVIVAANDYTPVVIRTAFINKTTPRLEQAQAFIDYLFSYSGQKLMAKETNMPPVRTDIKSAKSAAVLREQFANQLKPLPLDVSLLIFSDQSKKSLVITEWESALKSYD
ncbi:Iron(III) transport system substrate-binding protein [Vibrio crassostreae]|uniref:Iron(III) transport system substrate-binding protein n=1 Tax=Vibrio crassostreae TaxID=246167 RepID=A0ABP1WYI0_9VIBR|nr:ABC transporter substrate-binding protein [Vibrio crassostreae]ROO55622.1 iron(III) transport system substrate-binding protein [Vibrio crassostreae]ROO63520.1 iron(III) transport system substrate-binding protein [Vibrio crassostreae]ROQ79999.1 iron(III) transport system substrate-binding protein [Vibrio crassostreae]ROR85170.1 iron(III) transport system substrate-binding protein [Vibrio crassostreae]RPF03506.1 iron(III) transport system substrate-binding protein [Vibrio crassostreae]